MAAPDHMAEMLAAIHGLQETQSRLVSAVEALSKQSSSSLDPSLAAGLEHPVGSLSPGLDKKSSADRRTGSSTSDTVVLATQEDATSPPLPPPSSPTQRSGFTSRIILT